MKFAWVSSGRDRQGGDRRGVRGGDEAAFILHFVSSQQLGEIRDILT